MSRIFDLTEAAQIMSNNRISGLPIVDSVDNLLGIVTKTDIAKALGNEVGAIRDRYLFHIRPYLVYFVAFDLIIKLLTYEFDNIKNGVMVFG